MTRKATQARPRVTMLAKEEEQRLATAWVEDRDYDAREKILLAYGPLASKRAAEIAGASGVKQMTSDLIQEANLAMIAALDQFDPTRKNEKGTTNQFGTYARWHIDSAVRRAIMDMSGPTRIGTNVHDKRIYFGLRAARRKLERQLGRELNADDIQTLAEELNVPVSAIERMAPRLHRQDVTLDIGFTHGEDTGETENYSISHYLHSSEASPEEAAIESHDKPAVKTLLAEVVNELPEKLRIVIENRILNENKISLAKLGLQLRLSKKSVQELEGDALAALRAMLEERDLNLSDLLVE